MRVGVIVQQFGNEERREWGDFGGWDDTLTGGGGGDLVETFELHKITSKPIFHSPQSRNRSRT